MPAQRPVCTVVLCIINPPNPSREENKKELEQQQVSAQLSHLGSRPWHLHHPMKELVCNTGRPASSFCSPLLADSCYLPVDESLYCLVGTAFTKSDWHDLQLKQFVSKFLKEEKYIHTNHSRSEAVFLTGICSYWGRKLEGKLHHSPQLALFRTSCSCYPKHLQGMSISGVCLWMASFWDWGFGLRRRCPPIPLFSSTTHWIKQNTGRIANASGLICHLSCRAYPLVRERVWRLSVEEPVSVMWQLQLTDPDSSKAMQLNFVTPLLLPCCQAKTSLN